MVPPNKDLDEHLDAYIRYKMASDSRSGTAQGQMRQRGKKEFKVPVWVIILVLLGLLSGKVHIGWFLTVMGVGALLYALGTVLEKKS